MATGRSLSTGADPTRAALGRLAVAAVTFVGLAVAVSDQRFLRGETALLQLVNDVPTPLGWPLRVVMQLGTLVVALVVVGGVAWWTRAGGPRPAGVRPAGAVLLAALVAYRIDNVVKDVIERSRPGPLVADLHLRETAAGFGFPSGHSTMAFALAASLHPTLPPARRWWVWVLAALVGVARMHVGVHWPADVVGGAALGTAVGTAAWLLVARPRSQRVQAAAARQ